MVSPVSSIQARPDVRNAIQNASTRSGVDFDYLFRQARVESNLDPDARSSTSSATGLFQFIEQSWFGTLARHGNTYGLGWAASAIVQGADGRFSIADPAMRRAVLDLRHDAGASADMAAAYANDNRAHLESSLGRGVQRVDLYLAHFLGAAGAARFLRRLDEDPATAAASVVPAAARSNRGIFYAPGGRPRSLEDVRALFERKLGGAEVPVMHPVASLRPTAETPVASRQARLMYLMLASLGASA